MEYNSEPPNPNQQEMNELRGRASATDLQQDTMAMQLAEQETNLVKEQLSLVDELDIIQHLLHGDTKETDRKEGVYYWKKPTNPDMIILTDYGVHLIMNTIQFYLNKNTLLSNYEGAVIDKKMEDFATALADVIFMEYEKVFSYPTFEECKNVLLARIDKKKELRKFAYELMGKEVNEGEIKQEFINEIEGNIEKEITKIKEQIIKNKLKRFEIILREVQDTVHSTYLRAWNGQERRTLRQHTHISETVGMTPPTVRNPSKSPFNFFKR